MFCWSPRSSPLPAILLASTWYTSGEGCNKDFLGDNRLFLFNPLPMVGEIASGEQLSTFCWPQGRQVRWEVSVSYCTFLLFQGTNGSQVWDTAFAIQAFLEVIIFLCFDLGLNRGKHGCSSVILGRISL